MQAYHRAAQAALALQDFKQALLLLAEGMQHCQDAHELQTLRQVLLVQACVISMGCICQMLCDLHNLSFSDCKQSLCFSLFIARCTDLPDERNWLPP